MNSGMIGARRCAIIPARKVSVPISPPVRLSLLGSFRLERDGNVVRLPRRKVESLLSFLALYPESHSREELATLLWGDSTDDRARHSLRTALDSLRGTLGDQVLLADRAEVQLSPELDLWLDVREFDQLAKAKSSAGSEGDDIANLLQAVALYRGELLAGYYHEWILPLRERLRGLQIETLLRITQYERSQSEFARAREPIPAIVPSGRRAVIPEMKTSLPWASITVACENTPLGVRILSVLTSRFAIFRSFRIFQMASGRRQAPAIPSQAAARFPRPPTATPPAPPRFRV